MFWAEIERRLRERLEQERAYLERIDPSQSQIEIGRVQGRIEMIRLFLSDRWKQEITQGMNQEA